MIYSHEVFMQRALDLAKMGDKRVAPNPFVGSVLVHDGRIIGEGYHEYYGGPHAEVNCIHSVCEDDQKYIPSSTLYVTLEPCCFHGNTPACTGIIIKSKIPKVVLACVDPNEKVAGKGIDILKVNGVEVISGILQEDASYLIRPFIRYLQKTPYIILKVVKSKDGYIGNKTKQIWLSNGFSTTLSHKWRSEIHGIMVGRNTVLIDNPSLTNRHWSGENPTRIVWDKSLNLGKELAVFDNSAPTIILNQVKDEVIDNLRFMNVSGMTLEEISKLLFAHGIFTLIVEGGSATISQFYSKDLWDEARIITTAKNLSSNTSEDMISAVGIFELVSEEFKLDDDKVEILLNSGR